MTDTPQGGESVPASGSSMAALPNNQDPSIKPQAKADVDPILRTQLTALQTQAAAEWPARLRGEQAKHMMPDKQKWTGDLFDYQGMALPFSRQASHDWFRAATDDPAHPGTTGDLVVTSLQMDYLAVMERSFRARHTMQRPRSMAHAMARKYGHGHPAGPLLQGVLDYLTGVVKESNAGSGNV